MLEVLPALIATLIGSLLIDALARPRATMLLRRLPAIWLIVCVTLIPFGLFLALSGNVLFAAIFTLALHLLAVLASNAKNRMLGEPLLFSDLALVGAMFRHPQFYFSVLSAWQKVVGVVALAAMSVILGLLVRPELKIAAYGMMWAGFGLVLTDLSIRLGMFKKLALDPDIERDAGELGLVATLILYSLRWRAAKMETRVQGSAGVDEPKRPGLKDAFELIVVVQCESYADPAELFRSGEYSLPWLEASRSDAVQWGNLLVSGFGAYTMRTEYGVLFGKDEAELGFRLYDPYLTALEDASLALPRKLGLDRWRSLFVHPHDMRFYNRHQILPPAGFAELVSEEEFEKPSPQEGRYVTDRSMAEKILEIAGAANERSFLYSVTIENHGPWAPHGDSGSDYMVENYVRLVRAGDNMLGCLREGIAALKKPALLVFFGDHRPSIPGASVPGGDRHTPYVMVQFGPDGQIIPGDNRRADVTPAQLHRAILEHNSGLMSVRT